MTVSGYAVELSERSGQARLRFAYLELALSSAASIGSAATANGCGVYPAARQVRPSRRAVLATFILGGPVALAA